MNSPQPDLAILQTRVYRGPNLWSYEPAVHLVVDLGSLEDHPSDTIPGFVDGLVDALPGIARHTCSRGHRGGFLERLKEGTWLGHVAEHGAPLLVSGVVVHTLPAGARFDLAERRLLSFVEEHLAHQLKHQTEED